MAKLSVIIPLAPKEEVWDQLLPQLEMLPNSAEIIFVTSETIANPLEGHQYIFHTSTRSGRAQQMNAGAKIATGEHLWFLHADSVFTQNTVPALFRAIKQHPTSLLYFDLMFLNDASKLMLLNAWGVYFRSRVLKIPFGDQGLCLSREQFQRLNGFPENVDYGEDHLFVWRAHQARISVRSVCAVLFTSARKYQKNGWLDTTTLHQYLWAKQALPELLTLIKSFLK